MDTAMDQEKLAELVEEAVTQTADATGWANLAEVGSYLKSHGVRYSKLYKFLNDFKDKLEVRTDYTVKPPAMYARLRKRYY